MLGVIALHYCNTGIGGGLKYVRPGSLNAYVLQYINCLSICAVDVFFMISGYFLGNKKNLRLNKPLLILAELSFASIVVYAADILLKKANFSTLELLDRLFPKDWFIMVYIGLLLCSPFIAGAYGTFSVKEKRTLLTVLFSLFSLWPLLVDVFNTVFNLNVVSSAVGLQGDMGGYSIVIALTCFLCGAALKDGTLKIKHPLALYFAVCTLMFLLSYVFFPVAVKYSSPLVILEALFLLAFFAELKIGTSRIINSAAKANLTVYLLHFTLIPLAGIEQAVSENVFLLIGHLLITQITIYLLCYAVYRLYSFTILPAVKWLLSKIHLPEIDLTN